MQPGAAVADFSPLAPCLAEIKAGAEAQLTDAEDALPFKPTLWQAVSGQEDMAAFQPAIRLAIKMIVKGQRIGHIPVTPVECGAGFSGCGTGLCASLLGSVVGISHG